MSRRLVIAIDCDDVLINTSALIIERYNQKYGTSVTLEDDAYNNESSWQADNNEMAIKRVDTILRDERLLRDAVPLPGAVDAIKRLASHHDLHIVTGRQTYMEEETYHLMARWFDGCFQSLEMTNYIAAAESSALRRSKGEVCKKLGADILVDDHLGHIQSVLDSGLKEVIIFGNYPWNQVADLQPGTTRCRDWSEVLGEVEQSARR